VNIVDSLQAATEWYKINILENSLCLIIYRTEYEQSKLKRII
jgi:hypothetical protein